MATLEERLAAAKGDQVPLQPEQGFGEQVSEFASKELGQSAAAIQNLNIGLANTLGAPIDMISNLMKAAGVISPKTNPFLGSSQIREFFTNIGSTPAVGKEQKGVGARALRIAGETAIPFGLAQRAGVKAAQKLPETLNDLQKSLLAAYQRPWRTAGAESTAILSAGAAGETAHQLYPDNFVAEALAEMAGGITPSAVMGIAGALPGPKVVKDIVSGEGAKLRAGKRVAQAVGDVDKARSNVFQATELDLDPITATGDAGLMALEKAALESDPKLAERVANLTNAAMQKARIKVIAGGDPTATVDYLKGLRRQAAAKAQADITRLGTEVDPVTAARSIRAAIETSLGKARKTEADLWKPLPTKGQVNPQPIANTFEGLLKERSIAANPEDIPKFLDTFIGTINKKGMFKPGVAIKKPELGVMKDLRSRLQGEIATERAKDAPNRNKIRILGDLQEEIYNSLSEFSPEYAEAVGFSRELNQKFTQGKVGSMLGYERTGELKTSAEGTLDFLLSGNKDDVRMGVRQLGKASPETIPVLRENIKATFNIQALDPDSGALNVRNARQFLKNNQHILDEFPDLKEQVERSIRSQRAVDELVGAPVGDSLSTLIKDKSVTALYLEKTPEVAMHNLLSAKNSKGAGSIMKQMVDLTNQDPTGRATKGLKAAFGKYLLNHAETGDVGDLSGKKFTKMLTHMSDAANELYQPDEVKRLFRIGTELRQIEARQATRAIKGGVISDAPSKIIQIVGGTFAARAGAKAGAGTSGASLRTASIFTKEYNQVLGRLTNDGAEQMLLKAVEDPIVLNTLLKEATPQNLKEANKVFKTFLTGQALTAGQGETTTLPSLEERLEGLRQQGVQQ